jgi:hypothetical protein
MSKSDFRVVFGDFNLCFDPELLKEMVLLFDDICFMHHPEQARQVLDGLRNGGTKPLFASVQDLLLGVVSDYDLLAREGAVSFCEDLREFKDQCRTAIVDPGLAGIADESLQRNVAKLWKDGEDFPSLEHLTRTQVTLMEISPIMSFFYGDEVHEHIAWLLDTGDASKRFTQTVNTTAVFLNTVVLYSLLHDRYPVFGHPPLCSLFNDRLRRLSVMRHGKLEMPFNTYGVEQFSISILQTLVPREALMRKSMLDVLNYRRNGAAALNTFRQGVASIVERTCQKGVWSSSGDDIERLIAAEVEPALRSLEKDLRRNLSKLWTDIMLSTAALAPAVLSAALSANSGVIDGILKSLPTLAIPSLAAVLRKLRADRETHEDSYLSYLVTLK